MDYTTLVAAKGVPGSIADWLADSRIPATVPEILVDAQNWIFQRLRHWQMRPPPVTGTLTAASDHLAIPTDMIEPCEFWLTGNCRRRLVQKTDRDVLASWTYDGSGNRLQSQPGIYYFNNAYFQFDNVADQAYAYALTYYQRPALLSGSNATNWITTRYPRLLRSAAFMLACEWMKESGQGTYDRTYWATIAQDALDSAQADSDRSMRAIDVGANLGGTG